VLVNLVLNSEGLARVLRVLLQSLQHLCLLGRGQLLRRNNRDFLFLVELLVEFLVLASDIPNKDQALVLSQHGQEMVRYIME